MLLGKCDIDNGKTNMKLSEISKKDLLVLGQKILKELLKRKRKNPSVFTAKPKKMKRLSRRYYNEIMKEYFSEGERKFLEATPEELSEAKKIFEKQVLLYKEVPAEDKGPYKYMCHHHWRGKSCHTDLRIVCKRGDYAIGWTIDDLMKGVVKEPVITMKEAKRIEKEEKAFKINWKTGKFKLRRTAAGQVKPTELRAHEKARIPIEWMEVQGVAPAGTVGATKEYPAVFLIIDRGKAQYLTQKTYYHEYWMDGKLKGRLVFRRLEQKAFEKLVERGILPEYILNSFNASLAYVSRELNPTEVNWIPITKNGCIVFRKSDLKKILPPSKVPEGKPRMGVFWVAIQPIVQVPYVISRRAVNKKWVPPKDFSALPLHLKKKVPEEYRYWTKVRKSERVKIRDAYFEYLKKQPKKKSVEKKTGTFPFSLQWHWFRGPVVVRRGPSTENWNIRIDTGEIPFPHFECYKNPLKIEKQTCTLKPCSVREALKWDGSLAPKGVIKELIEVTVEKLEEETAEGRIYSVKDKGGKSHISKPVRYPKLKAGEKVWMDHLERLWTIRNADVNPTKNTPAYMMMMDKGDCSILEDSELFKKIRFKGKKLKGLYTYAREDPKSDIWVMEKSELPKEEKINAST